MSTEPPTNAPQLEGPAAPCEEMSVGLVRMAVDADRRRQPQPHHRPAAAGLSAASAAVASLAGAIAELVRVEVDARVRVALSEQAAVAELMSTADAARYAQVTPRSIRRWLDQGKLRALHAGRELRVRRADLDRLMRGGSRPKTAELTPEQLAARDFGLD